jgi:GMP synthase-like glutamine amidotransferase
MINELVDMLRVEHDSFLDVPWINKLVEFTQKVYAQDRVRLIGICFGHQIIGRALGVPVGRSDIGWEIAVCDINLTEKGRELFGKEKLVRFCFLGGC